MALSAGTRLGPYEIQSSLGAGGMGEVYRARDTRLERTVAVKILPEHLSSSSELKARFEREARAVSSLNHPHICHLYDVGLQDGTSYLVMEYLEGESLADRLRKGALPLKQALQFGVQIADALTNAHRAGILHRDLKPGNVMLTAGGAKLLDFGLAKASPTLSGSAAAAISGMTPSTPTMTLAELSSPSKGLTQRGTVVGTFRYMAPEVLQGAEADARSDVFSLGCVLYEMLTGRHAFEGKSQLSVLTSILEKDPEPVSELQPTSPAALDHLVKKCLEKNPDERFQSAHDVKVQLQWIAEGGTQTRERASTQWSRLVPWLVAGTAVLLMLATLVGYLWSSRSGPVVRSFILPPAGTSFVTIAPSAGPPEISPDGTRLTFTARDDQGKVMLYVRPLSALAAVPLPGTEDASYPFWSPDSREIGFFAGGKLKKIEASGGPPQVLCDVTVGRGGAWSKEGVIVFSPGTTQPLLRVSAAGGPTDPASKFDLSHGDNSHRWPYFLPDGRHFLFWARSSHGVQEHQVYVGTLGSLDSKPLMKSKLVALYVPGYLLFLRDQTLMAQPFNARTLEMTGAAVPIAEHVTINSTTNLPIFSASNDGTLVYQTGSEQGTGGWQLLWYARDGKQSGSVGGVDPYADPAISPDGNRVAAAVFSGQGTSDIWIFDLKRATKTRLTFGPAIQRYPIWTPDGKTVFYGSNGKGAYHIFAKAADGTGSEQVMVEDDAFDYPRDVSPDQKHLVYMRPSADGSGTDLWALPLSGERKPSPVISSLFNTFAAAISPNGKWIAYENNESGRFEVYVTTFPSGGPKWEVSVNGGLLPRWRRDGKELFFLDSTDNLMAVDISTSGSTVQISTPHPLFHAIGIQNQLGAYSVTADGKRFLVNGGNVKEENQPLIMVQNWPAQLKK